MKKLFAFNIMRYVVQSMFVICLFALGTYAQTMVAGRAEMHEDNRTASQRAADNAAAERQKAAEEKEYNDKVRLQELIENQQRQTDAAVKAVTDILNIIKNSGTDDEDSDSQDSDNDDEDPPSR